MSYNHPYHNNYKPHYTSGSFVDHALSPAMQPLPALQLPFTPANRANGGGGAGTGDMRTLCRVCGMEGLHSLHQPIPFYVHEQQSEVARWPKPIAAMLADVGGEAYTNLTGPAEAQLPQRICTICITYLKHAIEFRQQTLDNVCQLRLRLNKAARASTSTTSTSSLSSSSGCRAPGAAVAPSALLPTPPSHPHHTSSFFFKPSGIAAANQSAATTANQSTEALRLEIDQFFAEELTAGTATNTGTSSSSETEDDDDYGGDMHDAATAARPKAVRALARAHDLRLAIHDFFNYTETPFAEDAADADVDAARITVAAPADDHKERKCAACKRLFVLNTSYDEHVTQCVQSQLFEFVAGCRRLVELHRERIVSEQEFIRRMVFAVKGMTKALARCYRGVAAGAAAAAGGGGGGGERAGGEWPQTKAVTTKRMFAVPLAKRTPNGAIGAIGGAGRRVPVGVMPPPPVAWNGGRTKPTSTLATEATAVAAATATTGTVAVDDLFGDRSPVAPSMASPMMATTPFPKMSNFAAACSACQQRFGSIGELERHNLMAHNPYFVHCPAPTAPAAAVVAAVPTVPAVPLVPMPVLGSIGEDPLLTRLREGVRN